MCASSSQYQTGSWWPHQSWRDTHQGLMFSSQSRYTFVHGFSGWKRRVPSFAARMAGSASFSMSQNHWSEISGSMRLPLRCEYGTSCW